MNKVFDMTLATAHFSAMFLITNGRDKCRLLTPNTHRYSKKAYLQWQLLV